MDLWTKEADDLELEIETLLYPPSFQITVSAIGQQASAVTVKFTIGEMKCESFYITLPLSCDLQSPVRGKLSAISFIYLPLVSFSTDTLDYLQPQTLTIDSLLTNRKVNHHQLKLEIQECDILSLVRLFDDPWLYIEQLGLNPPEQADVKQLATGNTQEAMRKALSIWRKLNPLQATFRKLLRIVLGQRRGDIALEICKYLEER